MLVCNTLELMFSAVITRRVLTGLHRSALLCSVRQLTGILRKWIAGHRNINWLSSNQSITVSDDVAEYEIVGICKIGRTNISL